MEGQKEEAMSDYPQEVEVERDGPGRQAVPGHRTEALTQEEKLTLRKVLTEYPESKGWKPSNVVFGYLIGVGFSPLKANQLQDEYLEKERRAGR
jgi:hypothetical protein